MASVKILLLAIAGVWLGFTGYRQYEAQQLKQPYAFNHAAHRIMKCVVCHEGAVEEIRATLPQTETCLKCHSSSPLSDSKSVSEWNKAIQQGGFGWKKLTSVPQHVFFSHRRHTKFGKLECFTCHGDVQNFSAPPGLPLIRTDMDVCIDCQRERAESEDCDRCHK